MLKQVLKYLGIGLACLFGSFLAVLIPLELWRIFNWFFTLRYDHLDSGILSIITILIFVFFVGSYILCKIEYEKEKQKWNR